MILATMLFAAVAAAAPARDGALAEEYFRLAHVSEMFDALAKQADTELAASVDDAQCDAVKPILREYNAEVSRESRAYLGSRALHDRTIRLLQETYSDAELAQVNGALRSPGGRLLAEKSSRLTLRLLDAMQANDAEAERRAQALEVKYRKRFESVRRQCEAQMPRGRGDDEPGDERDDAGADERYDDRAP